MNIKKLSKEIKKYYFSHNQHLLIDTWEMREDTDNDCCFDVHVADGDIFLFEIRNYTAFNDVLAINKTYFKENRYKWVETWDGAKASSAPLYVDQVFTLPKFTRITEQDIIGATNYFIHEVLHMWGIFNVDIKEQKEEQNEII
jgi:hypothetical protein